MTASSFSGSDLASEWLVLWTKPRAEKSVARALGANAHPVWLPMVAVRRRWSDRWKEVEFPLFPGYLFVQGITQLTDVLRVPGVLTIVKNGDKPARIRDSKVAELRAALPLLPVADQQPEVVHDFAPADRVKVIDGPLAGLIGVVREIRGSRRLLIGFEEIGRAVAMSIGASRVQKCST
jgi:transcription antitermination factor NusG